MVRAGRTHSLLRQFFELPQSDEKELEVPLAEP